MPLFRYTTSFRTPSISRRRRHIVVKTHSPLRPRYTAARRCIFSSLRLRSAIPSPVPLYVRPPGRSTTHQYARPPTQPTPRPNPLRPFRALCGARRAPRAAGAVPRIMSRAAHGLGHNAIRVPYSVFLVVVEYHHDRINLKRQHNCTIFPIQAKRHSTPIRRSHLFFFPRYFASHHITSHPSTRIALHCIFCTQHPRFTSERRARAAVFLYPFWFIADWVIFFCNDTTPCDE